MNVPGQLGVEVEVEDANARAESFRNCGALDAPPNVVLPTCSREMYDFVFSWCEFGTVASSSLEVSIMGLVEGFAGVASRSAPEKYVGVVY